MSKFSFLSFLTEKRQAEQRCVQILVPEDGRGVVAFQGVSVFATEQLHLHKYLEKEPLFPKLYIC